MNTISIKLDEYRTEYKSKKILSSSIKWLGNFSLLSFILIIIFMKDIHIKYSILTYYSILCRVAGMMIFKYYEIPTVIHEFANGKDEYYDLIDNNREEILKEMFKSIYGLGYNRDLIFLGRDELKAHILDLERKNWKKYGVYFSIFYLFMSGVTIWVLTLE